MCLCKHLLPKRGHCRARAPRGDLGGVCECTSRSVTGADETKVESNSDAEKEEEPPEFWESGEPFLQDLGWTLCLVGIGKRVQRFNWLPKIYYLIQDKRVDGGDSARRSLRRSRPWAGARHLADGARRYLGGSRATQS